ncbi:uncharacterized protein LOC126835760 [Adelges cooleyi]|uniref:uncharacterized protein LOC126835760 n=1 Tax=Adelges cooleyi TaxID=133065 RepID=UPI0021807F32|nr:uncharacterized protein LOC126835760 [Adelges cooleyi]
MAWRVVLILLLVSDSFGTSNFPSSSMKQIKPRNSPNNTLCMYSRYMLYYFNLNNIVFKKKFGVSLDNLNYDFKKLNIPLGLAELYDEYLLSQGKIVLFMLDDLRKQVGAPNFKPPDVLMQVNLYLNNLSGTTCVNIKENGNTPNYAWGYAFFYTKMTEALTTFIRNRQCYYQTNPIVQDNTEMPEKLRKINLLLAKQWPLNTEVLSEILSTLEHNKKELEIFFQTTMNGVTYNDFNPEHLLFKPLLVNDPMELSDIEFKEGRPIIPRNVMTSYKLYQRGFASTYDLLTLVRGIFHQDYVILFQEHVIAAVLHPVFLYYGTYLMVLKKLHPAYKIGEENLSDQVMKVENNDLKTLENQEKSDPENKLHEDEEGFQSYDKHKEKLTNQILKLRYSFESLINMKFFPTIVQEYLQMVSNKTAELQLETLKEREHINPGEFYTLINFIYDKIYGLMKLYNLQYSINVEFDINDDASIINELDNLDTNINDACDYVQNLKGYEYVFQKAFAIYDHAKMIMPDTVFDGPRYSSSRIVNTRPLGYVVVINEIIERLTIKLINT